MKKNSSITSLLGITQHDMALLLRVSRSQYSMFELGKRDLPLPAQQLLAEILVYVNTVETTQNPLQSLRQQAKRRQLELMLRENEYQLLAVGRKISEVAKRQESRLRVAQLLLFLDSRNMGNMAPLAGKVPEALEKEDAAAMVRLQMKQELLELEKLLLQSQLQKFTSDIDN